MQISRFSATSLFFSEEEPADTLYRDSWLLTQVSLALFPLNKVNSSVSMTVIHFTDFKVRFFFDNTQHEGLSSYLSGLVVLVELFIIIPLSQGIQPR